MTPEQQQRLTTAHQTFIDTGEAHRQAGEDFNQTIHDLAHEDVSRYEMASVLGVNESGINQRLSRWLKRRQK